MDITKRLQAAATEWFAPGTPAWDTLYAAIGEIDRLRAEARKRNAVMRKTCVTLEGVSVSISDCTNRLSQKNF